VRRCGPVERDLAEEFTGGVGDPDVQVLDEQQDVGSARHAGGTT